MTTVKSEGKSAFLKEYFVDHPEARKEEIDAAWRAEGNEGTISRSLVEKVRADLGLTGKGRSKDRQKRGAVARRGSPGAAQSDARKKGVGAVRGRVNAKRSAPPATPVDARSARAPGARVLIELESEIDEMLHAVRMAGGLPEFEETLRKARRILARTHGE